MPCVVVKEILSESGEYQAVIERRDDGTFQVSLWHWTRELVPGYDVVCDPYWSEIGRTKTLTDTVENAEKLALEKLREVGA